jgi:monoamine oxidase
VEIAYTDAAGVQTLKADFCICTIPLNLLSKLDANFSAPTKAAISSALYYNAVKLAWEAPRFWEREGIHGGIAFTDQPTALVWYPSDKFGAERGVLIGAYNFGPLKNMPYNEMSVAEREAVAKGVIERLHPGHGKDLKNPISVSWGRTPFSEGISVQWTAAQRQKEYAQLCKGDGRLYFAGEHMSYLPAWQEGAVLSAHEAIKLIHART